MTKYLFLYHAPATLAEATPADPAEMEAEMGRWMAWAGRVGDKMVDFGAPLAGGVAISVDGVTPSDREVGGYSLIEAEDLAAAQALTEDHPHLLAPGASIEIHEAQTIPGM